MRDEAIDELARHVAEFDELFALDVAERVAKTRAGKPVPGHRAPDELTELARALVEASRAVS